MSVAFAPLSKENAAGIGGKVYREKESKPSFGDTNRKKLADITNIQDRSLTQQQHKMQAMPAVTAKDYIEHLQKENLALKNGMADRDKLIELTGVELQKLRSNLQKQQQQNSQLAQSYSQILHELNTGKEKLKVLQHELACKNGILKAKELEMKELLDEKECDEPADEVKQTRCLSTKVSSKAVRNNDKIGPNKRPHTTQSFNSIGEVKVSDENENKRPRTRRNSGKYTDLDFIPAEDRLEMEAPETSQCQRNDVDDLPQTHLTSVCLSNKKGDNKGIDGPAQVIGNKRTFVRRQSARFKSQEPISSEELINIEGSRVSTPACLSTSDEVAEVDKLKGLQHETGSKNGVLKEQEPEMKELTKEKECEELADEVKQTHCKAMKVTSKAVRNTDKIGPNKRLLKPKRFNSNGEVQVSDEIGNKRPCTRKQPGKYNDLELQPVEDRLEMVDPETSQCQHNDVDEVPQTHSTSACISVEKDDIFFQTQPAKRRRIAYVIGGQLLHASSFYFGTHA